MMHGRGRGVLEPVLPAITTGRMKESEFLSPMHFVNMIDKLGHIECPTEEVYGSSRHTATNGSSRMATAD